MNPADSALVARYPELPGLATLLDCDELTRICSAWDGAYEVERLRLKPGASVTAVMRPASGAGPRPWLLARGLAPHPWATKRGKDIRAAERARERMLDAGVPCDSPAFVENEERRVLVTPAIGDRRLRGLGSMLPDTGMPVRLGAVARRDELSPEVAARLGDRGRMGTVRTMSHNPARRFVGHWAPLDGDDAGWLVRLHADRPREIVEFVPGRHWTVGDEVPPIVALAAERARADAEAGRSWRRPHVRHALKGAAIGIAAFDVAGLDWSGRASRLASELIVRLADTEAEAAHGDFSADQLVVDDTGHVCVLDWDRAAYWPLGWDAATWLVTTSLSAPQAGECSSRDRSTGLRVEQSATSGGRPSGDVVAAAALLRAPEPFRRRYPDWVGLTEGLLALAERCVWQGARDAV